MFRLHASLYPTVEEVPSQPFTKDLKIPWSKKEARAKYWSVKSGLWQLELVALSGSLFSDAFHLSCLLLYGR